MTPIGGDSNPGAPPRKLPWPAIVIILAAAAAAFVLMVKYGEERPSMTATGDKEREVILYFTSIEGTKLSVERRSIENSTLVGEITAVTEALINGASAPLGVVLPPGTRLLNVRVEGNVVYADFSREMEKKHWGGSNAELLSVFAVVNTITENFAQIEKVQILIEGERVETLAGHLSIKAPLAARLEIIEGDGPGK